jgi:hypothetical protein
MLPNWRPKGRFWLHREFGGGLPRLCLDGYPASWLKIFIVPRVYPALLRPRIVSDFRGASRERERAAMVLPLASTTAPLFVAY